MSTTIEPAHELRAAREAVPEYRRLRIGARTYALVPPSIRDPRIHLSMVIVAILVIGITWLGFRVSIAQILVTLLTCAVIELVLVARRTSMLVWPASALQTGTSTALLFRVIGTENGDHWTSRGWYWFVAVAALGVLSKHLVRVNGTHVFNPSNVALVLGFVVLGSGRVEPLDYWWAPLGWPMVAAYAVIVGGGLFICGRLRLIEMGIAFWVTLAAGLGVLALVGHSITVRWSLTPISGAHFWWIILTSPEILIFLYFMITDPRTVPAGRVARIAFGAAIGVLASVLIAPWGTEFGAKVGLLASLTIMCAARPLLERRLPAAGSAADDLRRFGAAFVGRDRGRARRLAVGTVASLGAFGVFGAGVALAHLPSRGAVAVAGGAAADEIDAAVDPSSLPIVTIDRRVAGLSARLATPDGAHDLAVTLLRGLAIEAEALRAGDASLLPAVDDGARLRDLRAEIAAAGRSGRRTVPTYRFTTLHLEVVFPGGLQRGANAGLVASGVVTDDTYSPAGKRLGRAARRFSVTFSLRPTTSGRWLITDTLKAKT